MRWRIVAIAVISMTVFAAQTAHASVIQLQPNNIGLVGYWSFNEGTSTIAHDYSGNGNTGTLSTTGSTLPQWVPGKFGDALSFDGSSSYVNLGQPASLQITGSMTISAWFKSPAVATDAQIISSQGFSGARGFCFQTTSGGTLEVDIAANATTLVIRLSNTTLANDTWYYATAVYDASGQTFHLYLNGALDDGTLTGTVPGSQYVPSNNINIGRRPVADSYFPGTIDEVRVYNRALTATEVAGLYESGLAKINTSQSPGTLSQGLVGWWTMDGADTVWSSATAGVEYDSSGNGNNGTLNGMTQSGSPVVGKIGQALSFDGNDDVVVDQTYTPTGFPYSFSVWVNPTTPATQTNRNAPAIVVSADNPSSNDTGLFQGQTGWVFFTSNGSSLFYATSSSAPSLNTWTYLAGTYNTSSDVMTLYVNGVPAGSYTVVGGRGSINATHLAIGTYYGYYGATWFNGAIDDVRVYDRALSSAEVQQLYTLGAGTHVNTSSANLQRGSSVANGLVGYWTFDGSDISGSTIYDLSGNGNNGTNYGATPTIGKLGQALSFNGNNNTVVIASPLNADFTSALTISAWVKPIAPTYVLDRAADNYSLSINNDGTLNFVIRDSGYVLRSINSTLQLTFGTWSQVAVTYDTTSAMFCINGVCETIPFSEVVPVV